MANELIFDTSAKKTAVFLAAIHHPKWPYQGTSAKLRQGFQINWNLSIGDEDCSMSCKECTVKYSIAYSD